MPGDSPITVAPFGAAHLPAAHRLSLAEGWPHRLDDLALVHALSRGAVLLRDGEVVATALATPFGNAAMIGAVMVDARLRGRGLGRRVMTAAMDQVEARDWRLVATPAGRPLYERLGFEAAGEICQHQGMVVAGAGSGAPAPSAAADLAPAGAGDAAELAALDHGACGMDRRGLIEALLRAGRILVQREGAAIVGFAGLRAFRRGEVAGPVVARDRATAIRLLTQLLADRSGRFLRVDTPAEAGLGAWLAGRGLVEVDRGLTMRRGRRDCPASGEAAATFALAAQALG